MNKNSLETSLEKNSMFLSIFIIFFFLNFATGHVEVTNLKCTSLEPDFAVFEKCFLKSVNRSYKYASTKVNLLQIPVTDFSVGLKVFKRANGFKPFLIDFHVDGCKFLSSRNRKKFNPAAQLSFEIIREHSNVNHSCPFDHAIIVEKLPYSYAEGVLKVLPLPTGEYLISTTWFAYKVLRAKVDIFAEIS